MSDEKAIFCTFLAAVLLFSSSLYSSQISRLTVDIGNSFTKAYAQTASEEQQRQRQQAFSFSAPFGSLQYQQQNREVQPYSADSSSAYRYYQNQLSIQQQQSSQLPSALTFPFLNSMT